MFHYNLLPYVSHDCHMFDRKFIHFLRKKIQSVLVYYNVSVICHMFFMFLICLSLCFSYVTLLDSEKKYIYIHTHI